MMATSSNARRNKKRAASNLTGFNYQLYEIAQVLRIRPFPPKDDQHGFVQIDTKSPCIYDSCFQETSERCLLVLLCSNGSLLMRLQENGIEPIIKQFEWFQNPSKSVQCFAIDPVHAAWVIVASSDMALYLIPALAELKHDSVIINACSSWSRTNLTKMESTKQTGKTTSIVWWHTCDDRNVCIVGTEHGEIVFVDLVLRQQVYCISIKEKITKLELMQDLSEHTTFLFIHTAADATWQLHLEWPSSMSTIVSPSSYTSAFDMGYDMVNECGMDTILAYSNEDGKEDLQLNKYKVPRQDFQLSLQRFKDQIFIARHSTKHQTLEIFSDYERSFEYGPEYSFQLPQSTRSAVITDNLIFAVTRKEKQPCFSIISKRFAGTANAVQPIKKSDGSSYKAEIQYFPLSQCELVLAFYSSSFNRPNQWKTLFPHSTGMKEQVKLPLCTIVTEGGIMECRPRLSPEHYFTELCRNAESGAAEALGITLDLNVHYLCELVAEQRLKEGDIQAATKFFNLSECPPIRRANNLIKYASVTDGLIYITKALKHPGNLSSKDRKKLSDMAVACYTEQVLEKQKSATFRKTVTESFMLFLRDNFDYDANIAMTILADHGMTDKLFEVAKTKGLIKEALDLCASRGLYYLSTSIQNMLLDRGYGEIVCKTDNGTFVSMMKPDEAVKFLLMHPDVTKSFIRQLDSIITKLDENSLLLIARLFDPSRSFIKPYLDKAEAAVIKRSPSTVSLTSSSSSESLTELADIPTLKEIFEFFLKTIIILNAKRAPLTRNPERYKIGHHSSSSLRRGRTISSRSFDFDSEIEPRTLNCGRNHIAHVSNDNDVYTWGRSSHGRLGHGDIIEEKGISVPFRVEGLHMHGLQVISVACGAAHTIAVCREGVYSWGLNNLGQLGVGDSRRRSRPCLISQLTPKNVVAVAAGHYHTLAIDGDHKVWAWGWGIHGQLGVKCAENFKIPVNVALLNSQKAVQVAAGHAHSVVLSSKGYVFTFGAGLYGQLGIGVNTKMSTPKIVKTLIDESIYYIACGAFETIALSEDQNIYCWGRNYKQFHICAKAESASSGRHIANTVAVDLSHKYYPEELPFRLPEPIAQLSVGNWHYVVLTRVGQVYTWGCNDCGQLGHYNKTDQSTPRLVKALSRRFITSVAAGSEFTVCVDAEGQVFAWGKADGGQLGIDVGSRKDSTTTNLKKTALTILSPTAVPGLPPPSETLDESDTLAGIVSNKRDATFVVDSEFPDFSSIGHRAEAYAPESVLAALQRLYGSYDPHKIIQISCHLGQFYAASFCCELQQRWDKALQHGVQSWKEILKNVKGNENNLKSSIIILVENILTAVENLACDEIEINNQTTPIVSFILELFQVCDNYLIPLKDIEHCFLKRKSFISPFLAIALFSDKIDLKLLPFPVQVVLSSKKIPQSVKTQLSSNFLNNLISCISEQIYEGSQEYSFLSSEKEAGANEEEASMMKTQLDDDVTSEKFDKQLKQTMENKLKFQKHRSCIFLSSVTAATVSAASSAIRGISPRQQDISGRSHNAPDSVVFTCNHNFPKYYIEDIILPEFKQRIQGLPKPLPETADMLCHYYTQTNALIPAACPCCVYNNLRQEQLHLLQEAGGELSLNKSTFWDI